MVRVIGALAIVMLAAPSVGAQGFTMRLSGDIIVPAGTVHDGLAMTMNGRIQVDGTLRGDAMTMNGDVAVSGTVTGSVRTFNGNVVLMPTAKVEGDVAAVNGRVDRQPGAQVGGSISEGAVFGPSTPSPVQPRPRWWERPRSWQGWDGWGPAAVARMLTTWAMVGLVVIAGVLALLIPGPIRRIAAELSASPGEAILAGLALWVVLPVAVVALILSIVGIPAVFFLPMAVGALAAIGFAGTAMLLGNRLGEALRREANPAFDTVIGAIVLAVLGLVPGLGWLALFLSITWGAGGVVLLGLRRMRRSGTPPPASPA